MEEKLSKLILLNNRVSQYVMKLVITLTLYLFHWIFQDHEFLESNWVLSTTNLNPDCLWIRYGFVLVKIFWWLSLCFQSSFICLSFYHPKFLLINYPCFYVYFLLFLNSFLLFISILLKISSQILSKTYEILDSSIWLTCF